MSNPKIIQDEQGEAKIAIEHSPEKIAEVEAWLAQNSKQGRTEAQPMVDPAPPAESQVALPKDIMENPNEHEKLINDALSDDKPVPVTEEEETLFVKAILTDTPVIFDSLWLDGKVRLRFRTRTMHEMEQIIAIVRADIKDDLISPGDAALAYTRIQQYCVCLQLLRWNDEIFSDITLTADSTLTQSKIKLRAALVDKVSKLSQVKWMLIVRGLIHFESKCRQLSEKSLNSDFSTPRE